MTLLLLLSALLACAVEAGPSAQPRLIAHRGVHQTFDVAGLGAHDCTATRIHPVTHGFLENTAPSVAAAFEAGADAVEVDVHATRDGHLVLLHDEVLDCRTEGQGRPEDHDLAALRGLDLGYGYTADAGQTFPLRGKGRGLLITLPELLERFPGRAFVIDVKAGGARVGDLVADALEMLSIEDRARQSVYGSPEAVARVRERLPELVTFGRGQVKRCMKAYMKVGWLGRAPEACHQTRVVLPVNLAWVAWGYPAALERRLARQGSDLILMGPVVDGITTGVDDLETLARVPRRFSGWIWTNRVELLGPAMAEMP